MNTFLSRMLYTYWHEIINIFITNGVVFFGWSVLELIQIFFYHQIWKFLFLLKQSYYPLPPTHTYMQFCLLSSLVNLTNFDHVVPYVSGMYILVVVYKSISNYTSPKYICFMKINIGKPCLPYSNIWSYYTQYDI